MAEQRRIDPRIARGFVPVLVVASVAAVALGGLPWLVYVAIAGTAVGTLGLAYFTWSLAETTHAAVEAARDDLKVAEAGVAAATETARVAERARIDSLAPLIDLTVVFEGAVYGLPGNQAGLQFPPNVVGGPALTGRELETADVRANLRILLTNLGKTPGYVEFTPPRFIVHDVDALLRVSPGNTEVLIAVLSWPSGARPVELRELELQAKVWGPMTQGTGDEVTWKGTITLIHDFGGVPGAYQLEPNPLKTVSYRIRRDHAVMDLDTAESVHRCRAGLGSTPT